MAIININSDEESVNFLKNQSSILHTSDTNSITVNAVNVIVDRPKVGDVMCVTRYKDKNNSLLPADNQKVIWIDGLSINPKQLSQKYEPVGICVAVKGNKAMVRYRKEESYEWSAKARLELQIKNGDDIKLMRGSHTFKIFLINDTQSPTFTYHYTGSTASDFKLDFAKKLNNYFKSYNNKYSAELVAEDTDLPGSSRIIVNAPYSSDGSSSFSMEENGGTNITIESILATGKPIKAIEQYYKNNGFTQNKDGGCCSAKYYDYYSSNGYNPSSDMKSINTQYPVSLVAFTSNQKCKVLRDNFATYDEYFDSMMVKYQCGKYGISNEFSSGKENTYKLADCTFIYNYSENSEEQQTLYPAANWVASSIHINAPGLQAGNWWLPSAAEMVQMMRDITYGTKFWGTKPDIVNKVLLKLHKFDSGNWSMLSASIERWTSSICGQSGAYFYNIIYGSLDFYSFNFSKFVAPITLYEF